MSPSPLESSPPPQIVIVDDDVNYASCLIQVLQRMARAEVAHTFRRPTDFLRRLPHIPCDLLFLDIEMPERSGIECLAEIRALRPHTRIVMISVHDDDDFVLRAFEHGADGYLLKDATPAQIVDAVTDSLNGGACMSPGIARIVIDRFRGQAPSTERHLHAAQRAYHLTDRETQVLDLLAAGRTNAEAGVALGVRAETIKSHIKSIYHKMGAANRAEAVTRLHSSG